MNSEGTANQMYTYISDKGTNLTINNGNAIVFAYVNGTESKVDKCSVSIELQEKSIFGWKTIKTWSTTDDAKCASISASYPVSVGKTYKVSGTVTVWSGKKSESADIVSNVVSSK